MSDSEDDFDDDPSLDEEPIHRAAREGDLAALRRELDAGYSPDCLCTVDNITPLQILCMKRQDGGCQASNDIRLQGVKILLAVPTHPDYPYVARVHAAGGWKRYEQAHTMRLAPIFSKIFPQSRLPHEMVAHVVSFWAHVGQY